jgi:phosphatidylglycerol lysyltransferase
LHLELRTGIVPRWAAGAGIRAVAVSQALGFGAVAGAVVRWRCLPELWAAEVARLSLLATLAFAAALLLVLSAVVAGGLGPASAPAALSLGALT